MTHSLLFDGALELIDPEGLAGDGSYWFETLTGTSWGDAQPIEVAINSLLRDGALTQWDHDENREVNVVVRVKATDGNALDQGIAALNRATRKRTTLVWTPPDGYAEPHVFDVETSNLLNPSDFDALAWKRNEQVFRLRLVCQPYWRSETLTTEVAEAIPSVGTTVNSAESLTGWSTPTPDIATAGMLAVDSTTFVEGAGSMAAKSWAIDRTRWTAFLPSGEDAQQVHDSITLTQAISVPTGAYLSFAVKFDSTFGRQITDTYFHHPYRDGGTLDKFTINTASTSLVYKNQQTSYSDLLLTDAIIEALGDGWARYTFRIDEPLSITSLNWSSYHYVPWTDDPADSERPRILVDQVAVAETATLGNQVLKTIAVGGSARTVGALHVAAPSDSVALGQVLAYTVSQNRVATGFRPDLAQWVLSGATTGTVSGRSGVFTGGTTNYGSAGSPVFEAPAALFKAGGYTLVASIWGLSANFAVEASLMIGSAVVASEELRAPSAGPSAWSLVALGTIYLPPTLIQSPSNDATLRFRIKNSSALDGLYVFPVEGDLTIVDCGSGTVGPAASSHLWIDSPSADQPEGGYWRGTTPTRENAIGINTTTAMTVPGTHSFDPGLMLAFVASLGAQGPSVSFDHHKRYH